MRPKFSIGLPHRDRRRWREHKARLRDNRSERMSVIVEASPTARFGRLLLSGVELPEALRQAATNDVQVAAGGTAELEVPGYLELRELGNAPQQGGTPD